MLEKVNFDSRVLKDTRAKEAVVARVDEAEAEESFGEKSRKLLTKWSRAEAIEVTNPNPTISFHQKVREEKERTSQYSNRN